MSTSGIPGVSPLDQTINDKDKARQRVGPPPPAKGIEDKAQEHGSREEGINKRDAGFRLQHVVPQGRAGSRFAQ